MRFSRVVLVVGVAVTAVSAASADEVEDQIQRAQKAYSDKNYRGAIGELQFAVSQIQEKLNADYLTLLPEPLPGWEADAAEAQTAALALMGGGTQVSRRYHRTEGEEPQEVSIEILADSPMIQALSMMLANPALVSSDPGTKPYRHEQYKGIIKREQDSKAPEIDLMVANRILVKVSGQNLADEKPVEAYLKAIDLKRIEQAMGQ